MLEEYKQFISGLAEYSKDGERIAKNATRYYDRIIKVCHNYKHEPAVTEEFHDNLSLARHLERKNKKYD